MLAQQGVDRIVLERRVRAASRLGAVGRLNNTGSNGARA
jgi:hypothetical protein